MGTVEEDVASQEVTRMPAERTVAVNESELYPDGGMKAWLVVLGSWCAALPSFGLVNSTGVFADWIATHQLSQYSRSAVSWIFSVHIFFLLIGGIQVGKLYFPTRCWINKETDGEKGLYLIATERSSCLS